MLTLLNAEHFSSGRLATIPAAFLTFLTGEFDELTKSLHQDPDEQFATDRYGHQIVVLEPSDNYRSLPIGGFGPFELDLLESVPEYVEFRPLSGGVSVYRLGFLLDNECFLIMYIWNERIDPKLASWLAERAELWKEVELP